MTNGDEQADQDDQDDRAHEDDQGTSSDDLLREAKSAFGLEDGSSGVAASELDSSLGGRDLSQDLPSAEDIAAELAASGTASTDFGTTESSEFAGTKSTDFSDFADFPTTDREATLSEGDPALLPAEEADGVRFTIPDPGVPTGLPSEPVEVDADQVLADLPLPTEATAKAGGFIATLWRNRWIVLVAVVGIGILASVLD